MAGSSKPEFTFINLTHPDELKDQSTIDHIRSSAMTNFGRIRRNRRVKKMENEIVFELKEAANAPTNDTALPEVRLESLGPFESSDFTMNTNIGGLDSNIFDAHHGHYFDIQSAWSSVGFSDPSSLQTVMSNSTLNGYQFGGDSLVNKDTEEMLQLHDQGVQRIQQRLEDPNQQTTDENIECMIDILSYDGFIGDCDRWNLHMITLLRMIETRGGVDSLGTEELRVSVAWMDICGCFEQDIPPHLPLPGTWLEAIILTPTSSSEKPNALCNVWAKQLPDAPQWPSIYALIISLLQSKPPNTWIEPILHRLLDRPIQSDNTQTPSCIISEVCRLGTLLFLAPIWRSFANRPVRTVSIRRNLLRTVTSFLVRWDDLRVLLIWNLAQATREAEGDEERAQFADMLLRVAGRMGITTWEGIAGHLRTVLWVDGFQDQWDGVEETLNGVVLRHMQQYSEGFGNMAGSSYTFGDETATDAMTWDLDDLMGLPQ